LALIYAGIDEAGYGPMLGPLCVGLSVFRVREWSPGDPAPDLWARLSPAVVRTPKEAARPGAGVPIGDSKKLKIANSSATKHPLTHLERGVLALLAARDGEPIATDADLFAGLGADLGVGPWYEGERRSLPCGCGSDMLRIDAAGVRAAMHKAGIELVALRVLIVDEPAFNRMLSEHRSKAAVVEAGLETHLRAALASVCPGERLRVVADRQSGRTHYGAVLGRVFGSVEPEEESARASRYRVNSDHGVILHSEAEDAHLPVALASMAAKLVRELAMARFNRYWAGRVPELKPTAGYVQDARRWLGDVRGVLTPAERELVVRKA
jgi:hypothetical protein